MLSLVRPQLCLTPSALQFDFACAGNGSDEHFDTLKAIHIELNDETQMDEKKADEIIKMKRDTDTMLSSVSIKEQVLFKKIRRSQELVQWVEDNKFFGPGGSSCFPTLFWSSVSLLVPS